MDGYESILKKLDELRQETRDNFEAVHSVLEDLKAFKWKVIGIGITLSVVLTLVGEIARAMIRIN